MAEKLRVLFCIGINQNFFDLPSDQRGMVFKPFMEMLAAIDKVDGIDVLGTLDDDATMVGPSDTWPWTCYVLADCTDRDAVAEACNLFRTIPVGDEGHTLWRYAKVEARIGRPLNVG